MIDFRFVYRGLRAQYRDQKYEIRSMLSALRADDTALDVGCNKGSYLWALSHAVPKGQVIAFEPQPVLVDYLNRACARSGLRNVTIEGAGVSSAGGTLRLAVPGGGTSSPGASFEAAVAAREACRFIDVPTHSLDRYFLDHPVKRIGAIKIDVEGHELSVLAGAQAILERQRPLVVCECEQRHLSNASVADLFRVFRDLRYKGFFAQQGRATPVEQFDPAVHQKQIGERFWDAKDYFNNFVFFP